MATDLNSATAECIKKRISYGEWQRRKYPITTGINQNSTPLFEDVNFTCEEKPKSEPILIHSEMVKTHSKVKLRKNAMAMIKKNKSK